MVRHEQGGIHAARGLARSSGRVGVVFSTSGPGATNLVTGLADAMIDSTPVVAITGQVFAHLLGTDACEETDIGRTLLYRLPNGITRLRMLPKYLQYWPRHFYLARTGRLDLVL